MMDARCVITEKTEIGHGVGSIYSVWVHCPEIAQAATPGQFANILIEGKTLRRPISICRVTEDSVRFVFEVRGEGTAWLAERNVGETLSVMGPLGHGFECIPGASALLIGGGIGVPPLLELAKFYGEKSMAALGFRTANSAILAEDYAATGCTVGIATEDGSLGEKGYVSAVAEKLTSGNLPDIIYACGPKPLLKYAANFAAEHGLRCQVSLEQRMGCGVGACLVCACRNSEGGYNRACKDGPVMEASEVDWND